MSERQAIRDEAIKIWQGGVHAVRGDRVVGRTLGLTPRGWQLAGQHHDWRSMGRLVVVGAGKAGAAMAYGVEQALQSDPAAEQRLCGWVNVPARPGWATRWVTLHEARPLGRNEPTPSAVEGTEKILQLVRQADSRDVCLCLISGGASALLVRPAVGISLSQKQTLIQRLSAVGADIRELNLVRTQLSGVKGGRLAQACRAGTMVTLVLSDVWGDPLEVIGSGPTFPSLPAYREACAVLEKYDLVHQMPDLYAWLQTRAAADTPESAVAGDPSPLVRHVLVGNLQMAIDAAAESARKLGYKVEISSPCQPPLTAEQEGFQLADRFAKLYRRGRRTCLISGGEPIVHLVDAARRGQGGRNQQLVLAAGWRWSQSSSSAAAIDPHRPWVLLSGGTDGEDGSTDVAGALWSGETLPRAAQLALEPADFLQRNDAHTFFRAVDGLLVTGPTGTNVCDLRVAVCHGIDD